MSHEPHILPAPDALQRFVLANGIPVWCEPMPTQTAAIGIFVLNGVRHQHQGESGFAHLSEHLLFKGAGGLGARDLSLRFEAMGGQINAYTGRELMVLHGFVPAADLEALAHTFAQMLAEPGFNAADFAVEREVVLQEMAMIEEDPEEAIVEEAVAQVWGGHPMSRAILGSGHDLGAAHAERLRAYMRGAFSAGRLFVAVAGAVEPERLAAALAPLATLGRGVRPAQQPPVLTRRDQHLTREVSQVHQLWVMPGAAVGHDLEPVFVAANHLLGGGASSFLFQEVRERRGLVYDIQSRLESYADTGLWFIESGCGAERRAECRAAIEETVAGLLQAHSLAAELAVTRRYIKATLMLEDSDPRARVERMGRDLVYLGHPEPTAARLAALDLVSEEAVRACLQQSWDRRSLFEWMPEDGGP